MRSGSRSLNNPRLGFSLSMSTARRPYTTAARSSFTPPRLPPRLSDTLIGWRPSNKFVLRKKIQKIKGTSKGLPRWFAQLLYTTPLARHLLKNVGRVLIIPISCVVRLERPHSPSVIVPPLLSVSPCWYRETSPSLLTRPFLPY